MASGVDTLRWAFATLCALGVAAIGCVALWEVARARTGQSALTARHLRWRLLSALVWLLILGSLGYAVVFSWPAGPEDRLAAARFLRITTGALTLLIVALGLMFIDMRLTIRASRRARRDFARRLEEAGREEMQKSRETQTPSTPVSRPDSPLSSADEKPDAEPDQGDSEERKER